MRKNNQTDHDENNEPLNIGFGFIGAVRCKPSAVSPCQQYTQLDNHR